MRVVTCRNPLHVTALHPVDGRTARPPAALRFPLRFPLIENQHLGRPLSPTNRITGAHRDQGSTVGGYLTAWQETSRSRRRSHRRSSRLGPRLPKRRRPCSGWPPQVAPSEPPDRTGTLDSIIFSSSEAGGAGTSKRAHRRPLIDADVFHMPARLTTLASPPSTWLPQQPRPRRSPRTLVSNLNADSPDAHRLAVSAGRPQR